MLERELDRIAQKLSNGIIAALRQIDVEELAELIPSVRRLVKEVERAAMAERHITKSTPKRGRVAPARSPRSQRSAEPPLRPSRIISEPRLMRGVSLQDAVLKVLGASVDGLRSEEIQQKVPANARELREIITELLAEGKVIRKGQARGTRYSLPGQAASAPAPRGRPRVLREPPPVEPAIEISVDMINDIRAHLANSVKPLSLVELEDVAQLDRQVLRAALDKMISLNLAEKEGQGPALRFRLATPSSGEGGSQEPSASRIVRRAPRAKNWQPAPDAAGAGQGVDGEPNDLNAACLWSPCSQKGSAYDAGGSFEGSPASLISPPAFFSSAA